MNARLIAWTIIGWTILEAGCPEYVNHSQPHPLHCEAVEPVETAPLWTVSGALPTGTVYWQIPHSTGHF